jgi:signal transduction protein with GAF and PtsI domain
MSLALALQEPLQGILQQCAEALVRNLDATFARIWMLNADENILELCASAGLYTHLDGAHARIPVGKLNPERI